MQNNNDDIKITSDDDFKRILNEQANALLGYKDEIRNIQPLKVKKTWFFVRWFRKLKIRYYKLILSINY